MSFVSQDLPCLRSKKLPLRIFGVRSTLSRELERQVERLRDYPAGFLLMVVVLASIVPFLLVGSFLLWKYVEQERHTALRRVAAISDSLSAAVDRELDGYVGSLQVLASSRYLGEADIAGFASVATAAARSLDGNFTLVDRSGQLLINTQAVPGTPLSMTADPEGVRRVFDTGKTDISDLVPGTVHDRYIFSIRLPVTTNEELRYALGYVPTANKMLSIVQESALPRDWFAAILDRQGRIVARSFRHEEFFAKAASPDFVARLAGSNGLLESVDLEGRETVTAYRRSSLSQWWTVVWVPKAVLQARADTALWVLVGLTVCTLVVSLIVGYLVAYLIRRPARQLLSAAHSLGAGAEVQFDRTLMREANVVGGALSDASRDIRLYMREISHRSKNLLAVVQSIARQTRRNSTDLRDFGQRFDDRLLSLARSHDLLVERNWSGTFVHELVKAQLRSFVDDSDARLEITGDPVLLSPGASQHIGLALHASKYGALSVPEGRVHVAWSRGPGADGTEHFRMSWQERGGPALSEPSRKGFGRYVVEEAVARGVTGSATILWNPDGLLWTLDAPTNCLVSETPLQLDEPSR